MNYTLTKVKTFTGREGTGFNADLLRDGVKIAEVSDAGDGGCLWFAWLDQGTRAPHPANGMPMTAEERKLNDYTQTLAPENIGDGSGGVLMSKPDPDAFVCRLFDYVMAERDLRSLLRRRIAFVGADGRVRQWPSQVKPTPENIAKMTRSLSEPGARILNTMPFDEALSAYMGGT